MNGGERRCAAVHQDARATFHDNRPLQMNRMAEAFKSDAGPNPLRGCARFPHARAEYGEQPRRVPVERLGVPGSPERERASVQSRARPASRDPS